jgi:hypothetical protein
MNKNHAFTYNEPIKVESVTQAVCDLALRFGESTEDDEPMMSRPFGVALLVAGVDENGPQLYAKRRWSAYHRSQGLLSGIMRTRLGRLCAMTQRRLGLEARERRPSCKTPGTRWDRQNYPRLASR